MHNNYKTGEIQEMNERAESSEEEERYRKRKPYKLVAVMQDMRIHG